MPKFKLETKVQAKDMFLNMNVTKVFSQQAELGSISDDQPLGDEYFKVTTQTKITFPSPLFRHQQHPPQLCH